MGIHLRQKHLRDGRRSLYLDIYHDGKRQYEFLEIYLENDTPANRPANRAKEQTAKLIRNQRENDLARGTHGFESRQRRKTSFLAFFTTLKDSKSPGNRAVWQTALNHLNNYAGDSDVRFNQIDKEWIIGFRNYLLSLMSNNSAHTLFAKLRAALREAVASEIILSNPMQRLSKKDLIKPVETKRNYLTFEELQQLANTRCSDEEVKRAFLFSCYSGLRLGDVEMLLYGNIRAGRVEFSQGKVNTEEYLDLSPQALEFIGTAGAPKEPVFRLPYRAKIGQVLKAWAEDAKIAHRITFHTSRHTYATLLLTYDTDLYTVSKLLGHKSIQSTQVYAKIIDRKRQEAVNRLPTLQASQSAHGAVNLTEHHAIADQNSPPSL